MADFSFAGLDGAVAAGLTTKMQSDQVSFDGASLDDAVLNIDGTSFKGSTNLENIVGTWWNHQIIKTAAQISAISGRVIEQEVIFVGKEEVKIGDKTYKTLHFKFKSSDETLPDSKKLNTDIWYEEDSYLWVKAQFVKQGNWEYRIKEVK